MTNTEMSPSRRQAVLSCFCYTLASVLLTLANKAVFSERKLDYPWMLLSLQSFVVCVILGGYVILAHRRWPLNVKLLQTLAMPCLSFTMFIYSNGMSCADNSGTLLIRSVLWCLQNLL